MLLLGSQAFGARPATVPVAGNAPPPPAAAALVSKLAVLRRAQTPADVLPTPVSTPGRAGRIIPSLTRLVATPPGDELFLVVTTPAPGSAPLWSPRLGDQVAIVAVSTAGSFESEAIPAAELTNADALMQVGAPPRPGGTPGPAYDVEIVPDGVARVQWTFADRVGKPAGVVNAAATDNVAVTGLHPSTALLLRGAWYAPDGQLIPTSDRVLRRALAARQKLLTARAIRFDERHSYRAAPALLADFAVFDVTSRRGVKTAAGNIVSHPRLASLPYPILELLAPNEPPQLDLNQVRAVTTASGVRFWIVPGRRGMCIGSVLAPRFPNGLGSGAAAACTADLSLAESQGVGFSAGDSGVHITCRVVPRTIPTITIRTRRGTRKTIAVPDGIYVTKRRVKRRGTAPPVVTVGSGH